MNHRSNLLTLSLIALAGAWTPNAAATTSHDSWNEPCRATASRARKGNLLDARADYWVQLGKCANVSDLGDRVDCVFETFQEYWDRVEEAGEIYEARLDLCTALGGGRYDPEIDPDDFSTTIDNPYLPLVPGVTRTYEAFSDGELETIVVTVTSETREIMGVECVVVRDVVTIDGESIEDTFDYFAQDAQGNVWYFGEIAMNYEDGYLVDVDGSWIAGVDGAKAGIVMKAAPCTGDVYRQEFLLDEAEDAGRVLSLAAQATVPAGMFSNCLKTLDFTPLEPGHEEEKFYALGVGLVLEVSPENGNRVELISVTGP